MIPNFNPNKWDREKIIDYVIGDMPLDDQQLEFLNYFDKLQQENKKLKDTILCYQLHTEVAQNSHGSINGNELICNLFTENKNIKNILTEFEKWLEEEIKQAKELDSKEYHDEINLIITTYKFVLIRLQELKEDNK